MTSRLRIGVLKGRPAAMIFAILCAVIVFAGGPTKALADRNYIVQLLGTTNESLCEKIFVRAATYALYTINWCGNVNAPCRRHVRSYAHANIATARSIMQTAINAVDDSEDVRAIVKSGSTC